MTDHSSITSVTEEDDSIESDTTETSCSRTSDGVSSVMYSSEYNTDDKLTPSLIKVSISKNNNSYMSKKYFKTCEVTSSLNESSVVSGPYPFGCNPIPLDKIKKQKFTQPKKRQKHCHSNALTKYVLQKKLSHQTQSCLPKQEEENFGVDDPNNYLYTDFSDTSSILLQDDEHGVNLDSVSVSGSDEKNTLDSDSQDSYLPDMSSGSWFQAKCFDRYWSHYRFAMEWYRKHIQAIAMLSSHWSQSDTAETEINRPKQKKKNKTRSKNRARNRRLAKAKQRAARADEQQINETSRALDMDSPSEEIEMEITDEMMDFLATSYKHRMEREHKKTEEINNSHIEGRAREKGANHSEITCVHGPIEQPGVRRAAEMKILYGEGSPMIHGMETALQMTFDKILDRHRPKMWPNMPLKITFA